MSPKAFCLSRENAQRYATSCRITSMRRSAPTVSLADVKPDGSVTVHTHSQNPQFLRMAIAKMLGKPESRCRHPHLSRRWSLRSFQRR